MVQVFPLPVNSFFSAIETALLLEQTKFYTSPNNYFAEHGINVTANDWWFQQVGNRQPIFNEEGTGLPNHYMYKITDALALGYVLSIMDPDLTLERLNFFLNRVGNRAANSLEILLDQVRKMLLGRGVAETQVGDISDNADSRQNYHQHLHELKEYLEKSGRNYCFKEISFEKALEDSDEGLAMRYALKAL
ncbi:hypothetical protein C7N83_13885, partial [Neisseria iguanae]